MRAGEDGAAAHACRPPPSPELQHRLDVLAPLGAVLVRRPARPAVDLAPSLLATRDDIAAFLLAALRGDGDGDRRSAAAGAASWPGRRSSIWPRGASRSGADPRRPYLAEIPRSDGRGAPGRATSR